MSDEVWRDGDDTSGEQPDFIGRDGERMYGGWFAEQKPIETTIDPGMGAWLGKLTPQEYVYLDHYRQAAIRVLDDMYEQALKSGELPHSVDVTAYFDGRFVGQTIRAVVVDGDAEEIEEEIPEIPEEIRAFVSKEVARSLIAGLVSGCLIGVSMLALVVHLWLR